MKIQNWNNTFTEENHIQNNPKILTEYIRTHEQGTNIPRTKKSKDIIITNKNFDNTSIVILKNNYWLKESEYNLWVKAFKNIEIDPKKEVEITYIQGMMSTDSQSNKDFYKGVINFK